MSTPATNTQDSSGYSLADLYFQRKMSEISRLTKEIVTYYSLQFIAIKHEGEGRIREFLQRHGSLRTMRIPGFDENEIPVLEDILRAQ